jgi:hypothetical protein
MFGIPRKKEPERENTYEQEIESQERRENLINFEENREL